MPLFHLTGRPKKNCFKCGPYSKRGLRTTERLQVEIEEALYECHISLHYTVLISQSLVIVWFYFISFRAFTVPTRANQKDIVVLVQKTRTRLTPSHTAKAATPKESGNVSDRLPTIHPNRDIHRIRMKSRAFCQKPAQSRTTTRISCLRWEFLKDSRSFRQTIAKTRSKLKSKRFLCTTAIIPHKNTIPVYRKFPKSAHSLLCWSSIFANCIKNWSCDNIKLFNVVH